MELRAATAGVHERVDAIFSRFALDDDAGYARFLVAQAEAFLPLEAAVDAADWRRVLPDWPDRRRAALLAADLAELGAPVAASDAVATLSDAPAILGTIYVLEGSRLGGAMLARDVPAAFPRRFLGAADPKLWRSLIELLDIALPMEDDRAAATSAARAAFAIFEQSARRHSEVSAS